MDNLVELKQICFKSLKKYIFNLSRGYPMKDKDYMKIKEAMLAINFIENFDVSEYTKDAIIDFHKVNLNKL